MPLSSCRGYCRPWVAAVVISTIGCMTGSLRAAIIHRYSFDGVGAVAVDSVGGANGTILGGASLTGSGSIALDGTDDYVDLPNGLVSSLGDATFEAWVNWTGGANHQRIFDFGTNSAGEVNAPGGVFNASGTSYVYLSPNEGPGNQVRYSLKNAFEQVIDSGAQLQAGAPMHVAVTFNDATNTVKLFVNGNLTGTVTNVTNTLATVNDINNWLGRSNTSTDPNFKGSISEFRISNSVVTPFQLGEARLVGPDHLNGANVALATTTPLTYTPIDLKAVLPAAKINFTNSSNIPAGLNVLGGVPFAISKNAFGQDSWNAVADSDIAPGIREVTIPVNRFGVIEANLLLGTIWGENAPGTLASVIFTDSNNNKLTIDLDGNSDLRSDQVGGFTNAINAITTKMVFGTDAVGGDKHVDMTTIILPDDWLNRTLASITIQDRGATTVQRVFITGLTVATVPEPQSLVLLMIAAAAFRRFLRRA